MKRLVVLGTALLVLLLSACGPSAPAATPTSAATATPKATDTPAATSTPAPTATPLPSLTPTVTPVPTDTPTPAPTATRTATPLPSLTPTPATETSVIFTDDFGSPCTLLQADDAERTFACNKGEYTMLSKTGGKIRWAMYRERYTDFVIETDARLVSGGGPLEYGVVFRMSSDGSQTYLLSIQPEGKYSVLYFARPDWTDLVSEAPMSAIKTGTATNHIKVIAQGNQMAIYVNDQFVNTITDPNLSTGLVGLFMFNGDPNVQVAFSNLKISKINRPIALPAGVAPQPGAKGTPPPPIPAGMGGLIVYNWYGNEINYNIGGKLYQIPSNGSVVIHLPPGKQNYSANIPGKGQANGSLEIKAGFYITQQWADR